MFSVVSVCLSVCLCVYLSVFLSVQAITFELLDIGTSFLVCRYILTISRSSLSIKVIGSRSRSYEKKVKVKYLHPFKFYVAHTFLKRVVCIRLKCYLSSNENLQILF